MEINVWSDFACPYCYIGEKFLCDAIRELGLKDKVKVYYRSFELNPDALKEGNGKSTERIAAKYGLSISAAERKVNEITELGKSAGLDFNYGNCIPSNTFDAHRLMKLAEAKYPAETVHKLNIALFDAYFGKNEVLGDWNVLKRVAKEVGMDENEVENMLESINYGYEVRLDEDEAKAMNVRGVPFFVIDKKVAIPGCISKEDFKNVLKQELENSNSEVELPKKEESCCGPEGCKL